MEDDWYVWLLTCLSKKCTFFGVGKKSVELYWGLYADTNIDPDPGFSFTGYPDRGFGFNSLTE